MRGERDPSVVNGTCCSYRGPGLCSQRPQGDLDPSMNLCSGLLGIHNKQVCEYLQRKLIHIKEKQVFLF